MDAVGRAKLLREIKQRHNVDLHPTLLSMCERAARDIEIKSKVQKNPNVPVDVEFRAKLIKDAAEAIANQRGGAQANMLPVAIAIMILAVIITVYLQRHGTTSISIETALEQLKQLSPFSK